MQNNIVHDNDVFLFADETTEEKHTEPLKETWKVLIVDDEEEIHRVTKMVLSDVSFDSKGLEFISAYNEQEAMSAIQEHPDTAIILLDVVMDKEDSGLRIVQFIRNELKNFTSRIVLRTGQPGQAPEKTIIVDYDINDYKEKTELTSQKLFTTIVSSLRSYRDIMTIESNKKGLEEIIKSSAKIFELQSMRKFAHGVLTQLTAILKLQNALHCNSLAATIGEEKLSVLAATGNFSFSNDEGSQSEIPAHVMADLNAAFRDKESKFFDGHFVVYFRSKSGIENVIYLEGINRLNEWDRYLIEIYCTNVSVAFENIYLNEEMDHTQKEIIFTMGEIAETRSKETGYHVKRVAEYAKLLALKYGLPEEEAELLRMASPMHDVGKIAIPDSILNKPGKLTTDEFDVMKTHASLGHSMLRHSDRKILNAAATIALHHHEKYNGEGYPNGLKGEEIHIYGRIIAIADVFDALGSDRVYKKAWELEKIFAYFMEERGRHFDPKLVDIFFENLDEIIAIRDQYTDRKVF